MTHTISALPLNWQPAPHGYKHVVSVSIGSDKRDAREELDILGQKFILERIGTNGDIQRAAQLFEELDGKIDAFGLGGADLYIVAGQHKYTFRDIAKLVSHAKKTPVLDGSGLKHTLERDAIRQLGDLIPWRGCKTLLVSGVDRFGMAEAMSAAGADMLFGDLIFALGVPVPLRSIEALRSMARVLLPVITFLPFEWIYPTGDKQDKQVSGSGTQYYQWAEVVAGDFLYIKRFAPADLSGKTIVTNTTTAADVVWAREAGVKHLITTTPRIGERSFGTNVMEAFFVALSGKGAALSEQEYLDYIAQVGFKPNIESF